MTVRYTKAASRQIESALRYINERSPQGARRLRFRLLEMERLLARHEFAGVATSRPGIRRLVANPFPFLFDYKLVGDDVVVMRFRHAARDTGDPQ